MKKIIQRALPLTDTYTIHSYSYVPLIEGIGTCCENCGKLISNLVTLENQRGEKFVVGSDCAETLTIDKLLMTYEVQPAFQEGKRIRAKIMKHLKNNKIEKASIYTSKEGDHYVEYHIVKGGTLMEKIIHPRVTLPYIEDIISKTR